MTNMSLRIVIASAFLLAFQPLARACDYRDDLASVVNPPIVNVVLALRDAAKAGLIQTDRIAARNDGRSDNERTIGRMQRFGNALAAATGEGAASFSLLLVENGLWSRYRATPEGAVFKVRTEGALVGDTVVITGDAVLAAMESGALNTGEALRRGLLLILPGTTASRPQVLSAFAVFAKADNPDQLALTPKRSIVDWSEE